MRKRIRLHELRIGMYVEELEKQPGHVSGPFTPILISNSAEIAWLAGSNVMSVVINVQRGLGLRHETTHAVSVEEDVGQSSILSNFSREELDAAKNSIEEAKPDIRSVLREARVSGRFASQAASAAVERIMSSAMNNAGALIGVARLKANDEVTYLHSIAVSALMIAFGRKLGLCEDDVRLLGTGGLVHDLGKMTIPASILMKHGKLTAEETAIMRTHPQRGHRVLSSVDAMPQEVLNICLFHHERFDGAGYPRRLIGAQIPLFARIAAICDVYDALTTVRPYKKSISHGEAINQMLAAEGHFDRDLLLAFVSKIVIGGVIR